MLFIVARAVSSIFLYELPPRARPGSALFLQQSPDPAEADHMEDVGTVGSERCAQGGSGTGETSLMQCSLKKLRRTPARA